MFLCSSWGLYEEPDFSGDLYVVSEGDYPNLPSMGCPPNFHLRSIKMVPLVRDPLVVLMVRSDLQLNVLVSAFRRSRYPPYLCSASSVTRAARLPWTLRSSVWSRRASTTTSSQSGSTAAGQYDSPKRL